jgi:hypothetical protein
MSDIVKQVAEDNRQAIIKHRDEVQAQFLMLGALLQDCRDKLYWKQLGYETFGAFLGDPEITLKRSTAYNLINIYHKYSEQMGVPSTTLAKIGTRKLQIISPVVETDPERWLGEAENLSKSDLINMVRVEQGKGEVYFTPEKKEASGAYREYVKSSPCCVCGKRPSDPAHYPRTVGAGAGEDDVIPLCRECHGEQHNIGVNSFFEKYGHLIFRWIYDTLHARVK